MRSLIIVVITALLLPFAAVAEAGPTLYSPLLFLSTEDAITCTIRNVSRVDAVVRIRIVDSFGGIVTEGGEETLMPGKSTARGAFGSDANPRACEIDLVMGDRRNVRAAITVHGKAEGAGGPGRKTTAAIEMR